MKKKPVWQRRDGKIVVLSAFAMAGMMAMCAMSIDLGYLAVARQELQRSADAAAIAAAWELIDDQAPAGLADAETVEYNVRNTAGEYAGFNGVLGKSPELGSTDVQVGNLANPLNPESTLNTGSNLPLNAVHVRVRRTALQNGTIPLFFARVFGVDEGSVSADATAVLLTNIKGFRAAHGGCNVQLLPFALDEETCNAMLAGTSGDAWAWDASNETVVAGSDGSCEVNLFPQGTGSPGNRGTIDIGSSNNSTADIARQIVYGVSEDDLNYHGGELSLDENGELFLNGDTGISAGMKDELESIKGQPRVIPVFASVSGNGNNAQYKIVKFIGVRIVDVKLTGSMSSKRVIVQPANIVTAGCVYSVDPGTSYFVYSPVWLAR